MYGPKDISDIKKQRNRRILIWLLPEATLLALVVLSFLRRCEWLTTALFALLGWVVFFSLSLYILPLARYQKHLERAVHGRQRVSTLSFKSSSGEPVLREGVAFLPLLLSAGSPQEAMDDRQLYWDANLPLPAWQPGDKLILHSHEKAITRWENADPRAALDG